MYLYGEIEQRGDLMKTFTQPAVFVDRDGTINVEQGYICAPESIILLPTAREALQLLNALNILAIIVTNQSALGRGLMTLAEFEAVNAALQATLQANGAHYDALYYCPHLPSTPSCKCRKPQPGLLMQAAHDLNIDLSQSYMVGDKLSDLEAGYAVGCSTILVRTGFGEATYQLLATQIRQPDYIAATLLQATQWIIHTIQNRSLNINTHELSML